jgi:outer membrane protein assembly factor BamB
MRIWLSVFLFLALGADPAQLLCQSPQFRGGPTLTGVVETQGVERFGGVAWRFETGSAVRSSPALLHGTLFVGSTDGFLYALEAESGALLWTFDAGAPIASSPAVTEGVVLLGSRDGVLHGVSASDGAPMWRLETGPDLPLAWGYEGWDYITSSPTLAGGTAYWGSGDGNVYAVDPQTGRERWRFDTGGRIRSTPAVAEGLLVIGNSDGFVFGLDARSGEPIWRFETAGVRLNSADFGFDRKQVSASAALSDGIVYVGSRDASLYALDARDGTQRWKYGEESSWIITTAAVSPDRVFSGRSSSGIIRSLDRETGQQVWAIEAQAYVYSSPVLVDKTLYVGQGDGDFVALDAGTGEERWSYRAGDAIYSTPAVHNGRIYVGSDDGFVYAFRAAEELPLHRAVFFEEELRPLSFFAREDSHLVMRDFFVTRGYTLLDSSALPAFLRDRISDGAPSVVVAAMDALPPELAPSTERASLLTDYLEAGGKVLWVGYPPGYMVLDEETHQWIGTNREAPKSLLGVDFSAFLGDRHGVLPTEAGRRWGLSTRWVGSGSTLPEQVSEVLALDELGRAAAWVKNYGGPRGTGFILLRPSLSPEVMAEYQRVAEYFPPSDSARR